MVHNNGTTARWVCTRFNDAIWQNQVDINPNMSTSTCFQLSKGSSETRVALFPARSGPCTLKVIPDGAKCGSPQQAPPSPCKSHEALKTLAVVGLLLFPRHTCEREALSLLLTVSALCLATPQHPTHRHSPSRNTSSRSRSSPRTTTGTSPSGHFLHARHEQQSAVEPAAAQFRFRQR
jgi:hypothetical protein